MQQAWHIGVLVEPGMADYGGAPGVSAEKFAPMFEKHGIPARNLSVDDLLKEGALEPATLPVLAIPYGNAFPLPAFDALRAYHVAGGCLLLTGIPFCHPCEKKDGAWKDMGGVLYLGHDAKGMGTGGFAGPASGVLQILHHGFQNNPLGFRDNSLLPQGPHSKQWLDAKSLDPSDEVIPLVGLLPEGKSEPETVSALILHRCDAFKGAIDLWVGQAASQLDAENAFFAEQLITRGAAWILVQKGLLSEERMNAVFYSMRCAGRP